MRSADNGYALHTVWLWFQLNHVHDRKKKKITWKMSIRKKKIIPLTLKFTNEKKEKNPDVCVRCSGFGVRCAVHNVIIYRPSTNKVCSELFFFFFFHL